MVESLLHPKSIAIVGVSLEPSKVGHQIFANLLSFPGKIFPVNPKHKKIAGKECFPDVLSIPHPIDLVVIATPGPTVAGVVDQCVDKKVKAVIIITAGFAEQGKSGKALQERIAQTLARNHIALLGPNTLGAINPYESMNASFAPAQIQKGSIALISQSGAMLTTIFAQFASRSVGCSFALSLGNSAGIGVNEALAYASTDPASKVIALYVESIADIPHFFYLCKEASKNKPIILLKGGMTNQGQQATLSHTAALATDSTLLQAAQFQYGFTMVHTIEQFFETTFFLDRLLSGGEAPTTESLPSSLMILTNAGGPGVNSVDLASMNDVRLATWSHSAVQRFHAHLPRVKPANPTDLLGDAQVQDIETALIFAQEEPLVDSVLLIITPQAVTDVIGICQMIKQLHKSKKLHKPFVVALMISEEYRREVTALRNLGICVVEYANEGVEIFSCVTHARNAMLVDRDPTLLRAMRQYSAEENLLETAKIRREFPLRTKELEAVFLLLESYGCSLPKSATVESVNRLDELDTLDPQSVYPLIAKTANLGLKHKAVLGGVIKDINSKEDAISAYEQLKRFGPKVLFQEVITDASEIIIGCRRDSAYGTFLAVGAGGSLTNILSDRAYVFLPASTKEIRSCFKRTKIFSSLTTQQREHILPVLFSISTLMLEHEEIKELEINPLMVTAEGAYIADVKVDLM